jgi:hypothetical protein
MLGIVAFVFVFIFPCCMLVHSLYIILNYEKTVGEVVSNARSGIRHCDHVVVKFEDKEQKERIYTALNSSWGQKGDKRVVYFKGSDSRKVYALGWFDFFFPIVFCIFLLLLIAKIYI